MTDLDGRVETAVEEFVRWASPVMTFRRTATRDTEIGGQAVAAGEKVVMFYPAANRDESAFERPNESTSRAIPTAMSASEAAGRTSAWARRWPGSS